jgi:uncharacterized protein
MPGENKQTIRRLEELYARIPKFKCKRGCSECCGPVVWSRMEWERLPEAQRKNANSMTCPFLDTDSKCEIYEKRPLMCRLFGVVARLTCPYTGPEKLLTPEEENAILKDYARIFEE